MAKLDLSDAYRHILVNSEDWKLLSFTWLVYFDNRVQTGQTGSFFNMLSLFSSRSSTALFLQYADALNFSMQSQGANPL